ncbi:hypothetical protein [Desulfovibrio ferrophilus]|uniref:Uncharacterized protein n=1 Tax=Desulfovibrio ferrophilus TaxID=241368 RepID=A0A2Z6B0L2_9BACT|nr:hypothetical protein [Desulfovibrio ferrophilus]BBD08988.1 hypothetical protein DFE_2262 [Desulfovibrio ferrophilus]
MVQIIKNIPALVALNLLALINGFAGGIFDHVFEAQTDNATRPGSF